MTVKLYCLPNSYVNRLHLIALMEGNFHFLKLYWVRFRIYKIQFSKQLEWELDIMINFSMRLTVYRSLLKVRNKIKLMLKWYLYSYPKTRVMNISLEERTQALGQMWFCKIWREDIHFKLQLADVKDRSLWRLSKLRTGVRFPKIIPYSLRRYLWSIFYLKTFTHGTSPTVHTY